MNGVRATLARGGVMNGRRAALGARMVGHYAHFVRHGAPGPGWPPYTPQQRCVMVFNVEDRLEDNPHAKRLYAWDGRDVGAGMRP